MGIHRYTGYPVGVREKKGRSFAPYAGKFYQFFDCRRNFFIMFGQEFFTAFLDVLGLHFV